MTTPEAWKGSELQQDSSWVYALTDADVACLDQALEALKLQQLEFPNFSKGEFPLEGWENLLARVATELESGRGFMLLRGLPVSRYCEQDIQNIYFGIGLHLGQAVRQNPKGDLLGKVMNVGDLSDKNTRVYETNAYLPYHTDPSDVVGLLCLRRAKKGGLSSLVSAAAVYNEIVEHHPEFLGLFYRRYYYAHLGKKEPGLSPIFSFHNGKLSCRYLRQYIELGHELSGLPLSRVEIAAMDLFDSITSNQRLRLDMMLEPGDLQFANNYAVLHSRTDFEDAENPQEHRKMLRLWLKMPNARKLAKDFPGRNGFGAPVRRGIVAYHQDEEQDWVADLECGHAQHVRHNPPWVNRPWVESVEGRESTLGRKLDCRLCEADFI